MTSKKKLHIPAEIWLKIFKYLPSMSPRIFMKGFKTRIPITDSQINHRKTWDAIFKDYEFLNFATEKRCACALLGSDLELLYKFDMHQSFFHEPDSFYRGLHLVLLCYRSKGSRVNRRDLLLKLLGSVKRDHMSEISLAGSELMGHYCPPETITFEYTFPQDPESRTVPLHLHIKAVYDRDPYIPTYGWRPEFLTTFEGAYLNSAYLHWKYDMDLLRITKPSDIIGNGRYASVSGGSASVRDVCGLRVQEPASFKKIQQEHYLNPTKTFPWQIKFKTPNSEIRDHDYGCCPFFMERFQEGTNLLIGWEHFRDTKDLVKRQWFYDPDMEQREKKYEGASIPHSCETRGRSQCGS